MIVVFSGTGNSQAVAERLARCLDGERVVPLSRLDETSFEGESRVIWVHPVHGWRIPRVVEEAVRRTAGAPGHLTHHAVMTCGDDVGTTARQWHRMWAEIGLRGGLVRSVMMPNTYVCLPGFDVDPDEVAARKLAQYPARIETIARDISDGRTDDNVVEGQFPRLKSGLLGSFFRRFLMDSRSFRATDGCNGCGTCARHCPTGNITIAEERPQWGDGCTLCLGCYHVCPGRNIRYGRFTENKGQWLKR